jgi:hypothetical protein
MKRALLLVLLALPCFAEQAVVGRSRILVLWPDSGTWLAATSDLDGLHGSPAGLVDSSVTALSAATDGEQFLVAWEREGRIYARGNTTVAIGEGTSPVTAWDGSRYLVFFASADGAKVAVITPQGELESTHAIGGIGTVRAVATGPRPLMVWIDGLTLHAAFLQSDWSASAPLTLVTIPPPIGGGHRFLDHPEAAWNGREFYVTWRADWEKLSLHIEGARIAADGTLLETGRVIYDGTSPGNFRDDALLVAGSRFFKSWVGASVRASHDFQGTWIDGGATVSLQIPLFPPKEYGTLIALPNGQLAVVQVVNRTITITRLGGSRRRSARS